MVGFYIQGYLSGANLGMLANKRPSKSIPDGDALVSFVDTYCKRNPLERVDAALIDLYIQLKAMLIKVHRCRFSNVIRR